MERLGLSGGAGGIGAMPRPLLERGCRWASAEFEPGDCLVFSSLCVHMGLPNLSDSVRISLDARYCRPGAEVTQDALLPHGGSAVHADGPDTDLWEAIYSGSHLDRGGGRPWRSERWQRYWEGELEGGAGPGGLRRVQPLALNTDPSFPGDVCPSGFVGVVRRGLPCPNPPLLPAQGPCL
jgi:hypothetical protein